MTTTLQSYSRRSRVWLGLAWLLALSGCAGLSSKPVSIEVKGNAPVVCAKAPKADPLVLRRVDPLPVVDADGDMWVGITPQHYENWSKNNADTLQHIIQRKEIGAHYKHCIDRHNKTSEDAKEPSSE